MDIDSDSGVGERWLPETMDEFDDFCDIVKPMGKNVEKQIVEAPNDNIIDTSSKNKDNKINKDIPDVPAGPNMG